MIVAAWVLGFVALVFAWDAVAARRWRRRKHPAQGGRGV